MVERVNVLHVDDEAGFAETTVLHLQRERDALSVHTETSVADALEYLETDRVDCIVSDYEMRETDGLTFLERVRESHPDLPFILFTGKGSEEIAAEAISAGVTDYLQKQVGTEQYAVLANRIVNAVSQYRAERELERARKRFTKLVERSTDLTLIVAPDGVVEYVSPNVGELLGYAAEDIEGVEAATLVVDDQRKQARRAFEDVTDPAVEATASETFPVRTADGERRVFEVRSRDLTDEPAVGGVVLNARDVTERERIERELREQAEALRTLYEVSTDPTLDTQTKLARILDVGADYLGLSVGYATRIDDDTQRVIAATGDHDALRAGAESPLSETYCRRPFETLDTVVIEDGTDDRAYERYGLTCYVGAPVVVDGDPYGTLCFADADAPADPITDGDRSLVALLAQWAGYELRRPRRD